MGALEQFLTFIESEFTCLSQLDDDFVVSSYDGNFSDYEELSNLITFSVRTEPDYPEKLRILCRHLIELHLSKQDEGIWELIKERAFDSKKLCVLLWFSLEAALKSTNNREELEEGVLSSRVYILLSGLNSAQAYDIFNPFLYQKAMAVLRLVYRALSFNQSDLPAVKRGGAKKPVKGKKKKDSEISESEGWAINKDERNDFVALLKDSLDSLFLLLNQVSLSSSDECVNDTVSLVRDIARFDFSAGTQVDNCSFKEFCLLNKLSDRSFALAHLLSQPRHAGSRLVLPKFCLPRLLCMSFENEAIPGKIPNPVTVARDKMLEFLEIYMESQKDVPSMVALIQNVAYKCPDKTEYRHAVAKTVTMMLKLIPIESRKNFLNFLYAFGSSKKPTSRSVAIELANVLLDDDCLVEVFDETINADVPKNDASQNTTNATFVEEKNNTINEIDRVKKAKKSKKQPAPLTKMSPIETILRLIVRGVQDKSTSIRSQDLQLLGPKLENYQTYLRMNEVSEKILEEQTLFLKNQGINAKDNEEVLNGLSGLLNQKEEPVISQRTDNQLLNLFLHSSDDKGVKVRQYALTALSLLYCQLQNEEHKKLCIEKIEARSRDPSMVIRKIAAESLTFLMQQRFSELIESAWLRSILPHIVDREEAVKKVCSEMFTALIINPIMERSEGMVWALLLSIEREVHLRRLLLRCLLFQNSEKRLPSELVDRLLMRTREEHTANAAWMMLGEISVVIQVNPLFAFNEWFQLDTNSDANTTSYIAKILANRVDMLKDDQKDRLKEDISKKLCSYGIHVSHISSVYYTFARVCDAIGENATGRPYLERFNKEWIENSAHRVDESIYQPIVPSGSQNETEVPVLQQVRFSNIANINEEKLIKIIFSIGECIQYTPSLISDEIFDQLKLMMASDVIVTVTDHYAVQSGRPTPVLVAPPSVQDYGHPRPTDTEPLPNSQKLTNVGSQRPTEFGTTMNHPTDRWSTFKQNRTICTEVLTKRVRAQAVLTLGKLCLQDEKRAKKCIPVFAKQIKLNKDHIVRNNIVVVICDLCIRYTLLVDRYSAILAGCLKDSSILVRHQTITLLTNLIKEQFLKWEGQIMYRFVSALLDPESRIKEYAEFCLKDILLPQFPKMFVNHFLECLFYFNNVPLQSVSIANEALGDELIADSRRDFSISGKNNADLRMHLYKFMLKTFSDEEKFAVSVKICKEVFQQLVEGTLELKNPAVELLILDSIEIMCSSEMKLTMREGERDPNDEDEDEPNEQIREGARKLIASVFRQGIVEAIMPPIIAFKHFLQEKRSIIIRDAIRLIVEICKDHKEKIDEFLAGDAQLKAEIEFDIKRLKEKEKRKKAAEARIVVNPAKEPGMANEKIDQLVQLTRNNERTLREEGLAPAETTAISIDANAVNKAPSFVTAQTAKSPTIEADKAAVEPMESATIESQNAVLAVTAMEIEDAPEILKENRPVSPRRSPPPYENMEISTPDKSTAIPIRAISTPEFGRIDNLTFAAFDLSAIPAASPIRKIQKKGTILQEIKEEPNDSNN